MKEVKPLDVDKPLRVSKHVRNTWLRKWDWDMNQLREALRGAYKVARVGGSKCEIYTRVGAGRGRIRKLILVEYPDEIFVITVSEGSESK